MSFRFVFAYTMIMGWHFSATAQLRPNFYQPALIIMDMQPAGFIMQSRIQANPSNQEKIAKVIGRIRQLIRYAKANNLNVLLVETEARGPTDERILNEIGDYRRQRKFIKTRTGMFSPGEGNRTSDIRSYLDRSDLFHLIIVGANGGSCVMTSIEQAEADAYQVWTDPDATIDFNYDDFIYPYHLQKKSLKMVVSLAGMDTQEKINTCSESLILEKP